jgi:hypothetical protein
MAETLVGASHPLVAVVRGLKTARDQVFVVAAIQVVGAILLYEKAPFAVPLAISGGLVQAALGCRLAVLRTRKRDVCRELVIRGGDWLPLAAVERESRRLRSARRQARLARALEEIVDIANRRRFQGPTAAVVCHVCVLRPVVPRLREIAWVLRGGGAAVCGVALVERLLIFGDSPLYGTEVEPLRQELGRARFLLAQQS